MFLFNKIIDEDYDYMLAGYEDGVITDERLNDAVIRILATKASLHLHIKHAAKSIVPTVEQMKKVLAAPTHKEWTKICADDAVTLVKDTQNFLPLDVKKHKRILVNVIGRDIVKASKLGKALVAKLEKEGFEVTLRDRTTIVDMSSLMSGKVSLKTMRGMKDMMGSNKEFVKKYDAALIVGNIKTQSNEAVIRLAFDALGNDIPWYVKEIPTFFVSFANPYHLLDVPMIKTFINAYNDNDETIQAVIDKVMGRSEFKGVSPVDPFCGHEDTKL